MKNRSQLLSSRLCRSSEHSRAADRLRGLFAGRSDSAPARQVRPISISQSAPRLPARSPAARSGWAARHSPGGATRAADNDARAGSHSDFTLIRSNGKANKFCTSIGARNPQLAGAQQLVLGHSEPDEVCGHNPLGPLEMIRRNLLMVVEINSAGRRINNSLPPWALRLALGLH